MPHNTPFFMQRRCLALALSALILALTISRPAIASDFDGLVPGLVSLKKATIASCYAMHPKEKQRWDLVQDMNMDTKLLSLLEDSQPPTDPEVIALRRQHRVELWNRYKKLDGPGESFTDPRLTPDPCLSTKDFFKAKSTPPDPNMRPATHTTLPAGVTLAGLGFEFIKVPGGRFEMGCGAWQVECLPREQPPQQVAVAPFEIGRFEVTAPQWRKVMGQSRDGCSYDQQQGQCAAGDVSWREVQHFLRLLNSAGERHYRLPTEAEWEYACRSAGKPQRYCGGDDPKTAGWFWPESAHAPQEVGTRAPNGLGIYDMSGGAAEWTCSAHAAYDDGRHEYKRCSDGSRPLVIRGGSRSSPVNEARSTARFNPVAADWRMGGVGFRLVVE